MKSNVNFLSRTKKFINDNVWLQPLLLVGLIFVVIFSLNQIPSWVESVGDWLNIGGSSRLTKMTYNEMQAKIATGDEFVVIFTQDGCAACEQIKPRLDKWLGLAENKDVVVYQIDLTRENNVYVDTGITVTKLTTFTNTLNTYLQGAGKATVTNLGTPTMIRFQSAEIANVLIGSVQSAAEDLELIEALVKG